MAKISDQCETLWQAARGVGIAAALGCIPVPMRVRTQDGEICDVVPEGEFGNAFVVLPAKQTFARWVARAGHGDRYPRGFVRIAIHDSTGRSEHWGHLQRAQAHARAMADHLTRNGVTVTRIETRLD